MSWMKSFGSVAEFRARPVELLDYTGCAEENGIQSQYSYLCGQVQKDIESGLFGDSETVDLYITISGHVQHFDADYKPIDSPPFLSKHIAKKVS